MVALAGSFARTWTEEARKQAYNLARVRVIGGLVSSSEEGPPDVLVERCSGIIGAI